MSPSRATAGPESAVHPGQFRLSRIQVVNWGTFHGHHDLPIARDGFLITGNSGSGKSTLIDAVSAVLVPGGQVHFNAAAQGSARSGRNFVSYVRGAWRREADAETDILKSAYLRPGAVWSAVGLTYRTGTDAPPVTLIKLMHLRRGQNAAGDVTHLHLIVEQEVDLTELEPYASSGIDTRAVRRRWPDAGVHRSYAPFARAFRSRLGISGEAAQRLLHRTLSAKSLTSLDQLLRDYMLDLPDTFALATRAADQFQDLREAHRLVIDARHQIEALTPLEELAASRRAALATEHDTAEELEHLGAVRTQRTLALLEQDLAEAQARTPLLEAGAREAAEAARHARAAAVDLAARLAGLGHGRLAVLRSEREAQALACTQVRARRAQVGEAVRAWGGDVPDTAEEFFALRAQLDDQIATAGADHEQRLRERYDLSARRGAAQNERRDLEADREVLARRRSNIDPRLLRARELLCAETGLPEDALRFVGEMLAVREEHAGWTGPIERVLAGFARAMLVPEDLYPAVSAAVDATDLRALLVYHRVRRAAIPPPEKTGPDSLVRRLDVADGPVSAWLHRHLAEHFDYACVETTADLARHPRAVTRAGQVKRSSERHEKDDRHRIDDRSRWVLGFDNEAKLADLRRRIAELDDRVAAFTARLDEADRRDQQVQLQNRAAQTVLDARWSDIDVAGAQAGFDEMDRRIAAWQRDNPEHAGISADLDRARRLEQEADEARAAADAALSVHRGESDRLAARIGEAGAVVTEPVPAEAAHRIDARYAAVSRRLTSANIAEKSLEVSDRLHRENTDAKDVVSRTGAAITRVLSTYLARWESRGGELQVDAEYVDDALAVLARLRADGLPAYEERFFTMLQEQSARNVGELARAIRRAPGQIRSRIDPVNASLRRSPFDTDRWLRIDVRERRSPAASEFLDDLVAVGSGSWDTEDHADAERRFARMAALLERLASGEPADQRWQRQVLDTRQHVGFIGVEIDGRGEVCNYHDSSSGLSGGQAQKLVFFCLAAALRYQLAPDDADLPRYGTVILDEAFDRADSAYTRRALDVFRQFGFHMVLATPLKLLQTLEEYIGGAAAVTIADSRRSGLAPIVWRDEPDASDPPGAPDSPESADDAGGAS